MGTSSFSPGLHGSGTDRDPMVREGWLIQGLEGMGGGSMLGTCLPRCMHGAGAEAACLLWAGATHPAALPSGALCWQRCRGKLPLAAWQQHG